MSITSYKDLIVWQKAMDLVDSIYDLTETFPQSQQFRLIDQMQRAAISIPSNIAEGSRRGSRDSYAQFLSYAFASGAELETQLLISYRRKYIMDNKFSVTASLLEEVMKMLNSLIYKLRKNQ